MARKARAKPLEIASELVAEVLFEAVPGQRVRAKRIDGKHLELPDDIRYWFTSRSINGDCDVVVGNDRSIKDLKGCVAVMLPHLGIIAVDEESPLLRIVVALLHEQLHQILTGPGEDDQLNANLFGCKPTEAEAVEERVVTYISTRLADCMLRSGLLRLPPIPRRRSRKGAKHGR